LGRRYRARPAAFYGVQREPGPRLRYQRPLSVGIEPARAA
jgi:hypothetical protein